VQLLQQTANPKPDLERDPVFSLPKKVPILLEGEPALWCVFFAFLKITHHDSTFFDMFRHKKRHQRAFLSKQARNYCFFLKIVLHYETFGPFFSVFSKKRTISLISIYRMA